MSTSRLAAQRRSIQAGLEEYSQSVNFLFDPKAFHNICLQFFDRQWDGIQFLTEPKPAAVIAQAEPPLSADRKRPQPPEEAPSIPEASERLNDTEQTIPTSSVEANFNAELAEMSANSTPRRKVPAPRLFHTLQAEETNVCEWICNRPLIFSVPQWEERFWLVIPVNNRTLSAVSTRQSLSSLRSKLSHIRHSSVSQQINVLIETDSNGTTVSVSRSRSATIDELMDGRAEHHSSVNSLRLATGRCSALCKTLGALLSNEVDCSRVVLATYNAQRMSYLQIIDIMKPEVIGEPFRLPLPLTIVALSASAWRSEDSLGLACLLQDGSILLTHFELSQRRSTPHLLALVDCADLFRPTPPDNNIPNFHASISMTSAEMTAVLIIERGDAKLSAFLGIQTDFLPPVGASAEEQLRHLVSSFPRSATEWESLPPNFNIGTPESYDVADEMGSWSFKELQQAADVLAGFHLRERYLAALSQMVSTLWHDAETDEMGRSRLRTVFIDGFLRDWQQQVEASLKTIGENVNEEPVSLKAEVMMEGPPWLVATLSRKETAQNRTVTSSVHQRGFGKSYMRPMWSHSLLAQMELSLGSLLLDIWGPILCGDAEGQKAAVLRDLLALMTVPSDQLDQKVDEAALAADALVESEGLLKLSADETAGVQALRATLYLSAMDTLLDFVMLRSSSSHI